MERGDKFVLLKKIGKNQDRKCDTSRVVKLLERDDGR